MVSGANWYRRRGDYLKEISKTGDTRATQKSRVQAAQTLTRKRKKMSYTRRRRNAFGALLVCFVLVGVVAVYYMAGGDDKINRGVSIGTVDVGGMNRAEALKAVKDDASATFEKISFGTGKDGFTVSGDDLGITVDAASAVDEAYFVRRRATTYNHTFSLHRALPGRSR